ncbi:MAG: epoxide hydrolase family protein [Nitrososphaerota archaeon]
MHVTPYAVSVPDAALADLQHRLEWTRFPDEAQDAGWDYGTNLGYLRDLVTYWRHTFDWRAQERCINTFAHFRAELDGLGIHFVHARGHGPRPLPLLLVHGWPSSFYEMLDLIPYLTDPERFGGDPADAFDVVAVSLPSYGFSDRLTGSGMTSRAIGSLLVRLMDGLGYQRFGVHTYDIGASIMTQACLHHPEHVIGYHTTEPGIPGPQASSLEARPLTPEERAYIEYRPQWRQEEGGYMAILSTRPQTLGYGLNDSPAGLAAWILEKWRAWTIQPGGTIEQHFTKDQLLTTVMIYWVTQTINAANRYYYRDKKPAPPQPQASTIDVPVGVALTTQQIERAPRAYAERVFTDIRQWVDLGRGGHFLPLEEPRLLAAVLQQFFRLLR